MCDRQWQQRFAIFVTQAGGRPQPLGYGCMFRFPRLDRHHLPQHSHREDKKDLLKLLALALIQHGLAQSDLSSQDPILLELVETTVQGGT